MRKAKAICSVVVLGLLAGGSLQCNGSPHEVSSNSCKGLDGLRVQLLGRLAPSSDIRLNDPAGNTLDWRVTGGAALVSLYEGADHKPTEVHVGFEPLDTPGVPRRLVFQIVPGEILVSSKVGDRFVAPAVVSLGTDDGKPSCHSDQRQSVAVEVVEAFASIDGVAKTIDHDFRRRFVVVVEWTDVACGIGSVRGQWSFEVNASSIVINCEDTFRVVSIGEGRRASLLAAQAV